jgi:hypothetical protein
MARSWAWLIALAEFPVAFAVTYALLLLLR